MQTTKKEEIENLIQMIKAYKFDIEEIKLIQKITLYIYTEDYDLISDAIEDFKNN